MKTIQYKVKKTQATTQYREIQPADKRWVLEKLRDIERIKEYCELNSGLEIKTLLSDITKPRTKIPRLGTGSMNSIVSAAAGILSNIEDGTQRDFSHKTCKIIEKTFEQMNILMNEWESVEFVEVEEFIVEKTTPPEKTADQSFSVVLGDYIVDIVIKSKNTIV